MVRYAPEHAVHAQRCSQREADAHAVGSIPMASRKARTSATRVRASHVRVSHPLRARPVVDVLDRYYSTTGRSTSYKILYIFSKLNCVKKLLKFTMPREFAGQGGVDGYDTVANKV